LFFTHVEGVWPRSPSKWRLVIISTGAIPECAARRVHGCLLGACHIGLILETRELAGSGGIDINTKPWRWARFYRQPQSYSIAHGATFAPPARATIGDGFTQGNRHGYRHPHDSREIGQVVINRQPTREGIGIIKSEVPGDPNWRKDDQIFPTSSLKSLSDHESGSADQVWVFLGKRGLVAHVNPTHGPGPLPERKKKRFERLRDKPR